MIRKIKRSIARHNLAMQEIPIYGKYSLAEGMRYNKRCKKYTKQEWQRSYFARVWRSWL